MIQPGKSYVITTDAWFIAPDGEMYRSVWGICTLHKSEDVFGFTPQRPSTNWFLQVGEGEKSVIIAGCQIHYAVLSNERPVEKQGTYQDERTKSQTPINSIYFTK